MPKNKNLRVKYQNVPKNVKMLKKAKKFQHFEELTQFKQKKVLNFKKKSIKFLKNINFKKYQSVR